MAERPTLPRISDISPPLYNQSGVRNRVGRTATAVNLSTEFANASSAFREASPDEVPNTTSLDGLTPSAPALIDADDVAVESPDSVPAFTDGGYSFIDDMLHYKGEPGESSSDRVTRLARATSSRYDPDPFSSPTATYGETTSGHGYLDFANGRRPSITGLIEPWFFMPVYPLRLRTRVRCIVEYTEAQRPGFMFHIYDQNGRQTGVNRVQVRDAGFNGNWSSVTRRLINPNGATQRQFYGSLHYRRGAPETSPLLAGKLFQDGGFPLSGVLVIEAYLEPRFLGLDPSSFSRDRINFIVGRYDTIEDAYAETRPGGAFACLEPSHPNYIGTNGRYGGAFAGAGGIGYQRLGLGEGRWHYLEVMAGDVKNDVMNRLVGVAPDASEGTSYDPFE